jgi:hypothetical protein
MDVIRRGPEAGGRGRQVAIRVREAAHRAMGGGCGAADARLAVERWAISVGRGAVRAEHVPGGDEDEVM